MIGGNDTRRHADSHAVDSFPCDDAACDGIAKIRAAPSELAESTVASEADFRGLFTAFSEATAGDTAVTTEGVCASEAALLDVTIVDTFAAEADCRRGGPGTSPCSISQTTPSASPDKYTKLKISNN